MNRKPRDSAPLLPEMEAESPRTAPDSSLLRILKYNFSGQLLGRLFTFFINVYLIRYVDGNIVGLVNVRLYLLYATSVFLSVEPLRKLCLGKQLSIADAVKYAWLAPVISVVVSFVLAVVWSFLPVQEVVSAAEYRVLLRCFAVAAVVECCGEPLAILSQKSGRHGLFAFAQSALLVSNKFVAIVLILAGVDAITALAAGQVLGTVVYAGIFYATFVHIGASLDFSPWFSLLPDYKWAEMRMLGTILFHSVQKQLITEGAGYVMTFTQQLSFTEQAVYDTVDKLGSLVVRIVLRPLEESCALHFAGHFDRSATPAVPERLGQQFLAICRWLITLGTVIAIFSIPYSSIVVQIYGGSLLSENKGGLLLSMYTFNLLVMAINGIVECFAFASMNNAAIFAHGKFLLVASAAHLATNILLLRLMGAPGFIVANILNVVLRIVYNWRYIKSLRNTQKLHFVEVLPDFTFVGSLLVALLVMGLSGVIFASTPGLIHTGAHIAVGAVMFLVIVAHLYQKGELFQRLWEKLD
ncbi:RFT1 domain containing protein [Aphelenchoides fujianensis]|nr:RFT1 domain containing protein [Aphelenchoides fujianensis]